MATPDLSDWELINAYADGELAAEDRATVERRLATNTALATSLQEIESVKAGLALIRPVPAGGPGPIGRGRGFLRAIRIPAAAAAVVAAITLGVIELSQLSSAGDWRDFATELHGELSANAYILAPAPPVAAISTGAMGDLSAFDLSDSRLTLVDVKSVKLRGTNLVAMHYRGHNGCSLTIAVTGISAGEVPRRSTEGGTLEAHWSVGTSQYLVIASGMDRARFEAIAAYARADSLRHNGGERLRVAVRSATDDARPCA